MILPMMPGELSLASLASLSFSFDTDDMPLNTPTLIGFELMNGGTDGVLNTPVSRETKGNFNFTKPDVEIINRPSAVRQVLPGESITIS